MDMPKVVKCDVTECAYNIDEECNALAITIGDSTHPQCDTFCTSAAKGQASGGIASVGACKVSCCTHNSGLECQASEICVGYQGDEADCLTFETS